MSWSAQQDDALKAVSRWLDTGGGNQVFRLFGYAGTGKTTLARHIAEGVDGEVAFGAFTGKAASVLRAKGCADAGTIHSMIYRSRESDETEGPSFVLNRSGAAAKADLIVIDECSMVDEDLGRDLLSFGKPVLVLGDPAQLPPIKGGGFFTEAEPDVMLTEVHRQAADNPIIHLSMKVREGGQLDYGLYGESRVIRRAEIDQNEVMKSDQVLVGLNRTRRNYNGRIRELLGLRDPLPAAGEKLVCLRNDKSKGLLNGGTWLVEAMRGLKTDRKGEFIRMDLKPEDESRRHAVEVKVLRAFFEGGEEGLPYVIRRESDEFTYGYALTVHKSQGSQWDDIVLFDESGAFRENRARWLYTGLTRAAHRITVVR
ncbi:MAG: exodeoxyribonuclease V [Saliniramus fredricksonii]|uniref:Exodeoxyribonuclease V n=1 Tax=Saliniramus fredricksonii TaxID=1653334 RepID=A0A0P7X5A0_9HYPH|nr:ATP-dependent RecD-like DNA helicase [Saliniramus fredricksonii]KPQ10036.1 MAG: exodeoxyribonuclease V [Saliniramus fredricksonii]SCC80515.1 exodeoxyribonuclease-5 [Saliniramus fredricksonii]